MSVTTPRRRSARRTVMAVIAWLSLALLMVWTLMPVAVMVFTSLKPRGEVFTTPPRLFPTDWTLDNYVEVFTDSSMPQALTNSIIVGLLCTLITLLLCVSAGYALARFRFPAARQIGVFILLGQMLPITVLLLPLYQMVRTLNLLNTVIGIALVHLVITIPLVTWMLRNQIAAIPYDLEEAAMIDGCSRFDAVTYITLPVAATGIAAAGMYAFLQSWHEFVLASVLSTSSASRTAPVALTEFSSEFAVDWGASMAASVVLTLPVVIVFMALQRFFVRGLTTGGVKG